MPYVRATDAVDHEVHGVRFTAYANPGTGSGQLAAWRGEIPDGTAGVPHTVSHEEVLYLLSGSLRFSIDGEVAELSAGDVVIAPAGARLCVDNTSGAPATMWVSTSIGLSVTLPDGTTITPPWAN
ncbi:cupin domain-containing protein [Streptacidiphilus sp. EB129]|uniref:cupin domain-containing protein n=1 Tax=Streptacidiphilus sp. EB129 TaxID=3156262 RepID=UPI003515B8D3